MTRRKRAAAIVECDTEPMPPKPYVDQQLHDAIGEVIMHALVKRKLTETRIVQTVGDVFLLLNNIPQSRPVIVWQHPVGGLVLELPPPSSLPN